MLECDPSSGEVDKEEDGEEGILQYRLGELGKGRIWGIHQSE